MTANGKRANLSMEEDGLASSNKAVAVSAECTGKYLVHNREILERKISNKMSKSRKEYDSIIKVVSEKHHFFCFGEDSSNLSRGGEFSDCFGSFRDGMFSQFTRKHKTNSCLNFS